MALSFHVMFCYHDALLFRVPTWGLVFVLPLPCPLRNIRNQALRLVKVKRKGKTVVLEVPRDSNQNPTDGRPNVVTAQDGA